MIPKEGENKNMETIIKQSADGLILRKDNNFDTNLRKVFINNHEITDINTFFKVAEENTRLLEQVKKQKEVIGKAIEYIKQKQSYYTDKKLPYWVIYRNKDFDNLLQILEELEESESDE